MFRLSKLTLFLTLLFVLMTFSAYSQAGHWELLNPINHPQWRFNHDMTPIGKNKVLLFGGKGVNGLMNDTWIYDLNSNEWDSIDCKNSPQARTDFSMTQISETKVLLFGGSTDSLEYNSDLWEFDLDSMNWYRIIAFDTTEPRFRHRMVKINNDEVLVFGGFKIELFMMVYSNDLYIYNLINNLWKKVREPLIEPIGRESFMMTTLNDKAVMLFGGYHYNYLGDNWFLNTETELWDSVKSLNKQIIPISSAELKYLSQGLALLFGGQSQGWDPTPDSWYEGTWIFNNNNKTWKELNLSTHPFGRYGHRMAVIDSDKVILFGGNVKGSNGTVSPYETWMFTLDSINAIADNATIANKDISVIQNSENELIIKTTSNMNNVHFSVYDLLGQTVYSTELNQDGGLNEYHLELNDLPAGFYITTATANGKRYTTKLMIMRR